MKGFNKVMLMGNLTRDPELKTTESGVDVVRFGLAINEKVKDEERVHFVDCVAFNKLAEVMNKWLQKGKPVLISGKLNYSSWESDGHKRSKLEVIVDDFNFVGDSAISERGANQDNGNIPF